MEMRHIKTSLSYRLPLTIEQMEDGTYMATSSVLQGLLVQADTVDDVIALAPGVAKALIAAMREKGRRILHSQEMTAH
ncbi:MAG: DUF1902 domain-containing protein [Chloroflexi bacterium]|nr:DUF1902 domain-containing protein [Chloroflexota bacterium]MBU1660190.1 DUF1902 domain-containing protein [Chloroflexota bacterium]